VNGKGSARRPAAFVPRCGTVRHVFLAGYDRCVCGERKLSVPLYRGTLHPVEIPSEFYEEILPLEARRRR
jgi:hypothetical protein